MQARRAGRRSRRARRAPASAGSASRAELGKGEKWSLGKYALLGSEQRTHFNFSVLMVCGFIYIYTMSAFYLFLFPNIPHTSFWGYGGCVPRHDCGGSTNKTSGRMLAASASLNRLEQKPMASKRVYSSLSAFLNIHSLVIGFIFPMTSVPPYMLVQSSSPS